MTVKNYYILSEAELEKALNTIRLWLFDFQDHPERPKALFALDVALAAKELEYWRNENEFIKLVVETLL